MFEPKQHGDACEDVVVCPSCGSRRRRGGETKRPINTRTRRPQRYGTMSAGCLDCHASWRVVLDFASSPPSMTYAGIETPEVHHP